MSTCTTKDGVEIFGETAQSGPLKVYEKFPHGMCTTHADVINADLLVFMKR